MKLDCHSLHWLNKSSVFFTFFTTAILLFSNGCCQKCTCLKENRFAQKKCERTQTLDSLITQIIRVDTTSFHSESSTQFRIIVSNSTLDDCFSPLTLNTEWKLKQNQITYMSNHYWSKLSLFSKSNQSIVFFELPKYREEDIVFSVTTKIQNNKGSSYDSLTIRSNPLPESQIQMDEPPLYELRTRKISSNKDSSNYDIAVPIELVGDGLDSVRCIPTIKLIENGSPGIILNQLTEPKIMMFYEDQYVELLASIVNATDSGKVNLIVSLNSCEQNIRIKPLTIQINVN